jgi:hypothetical protein
MYKCGWNGCEKAYGTLNHLNAHVTMQSHGSKRTPEGEKLLGCTIACRSMLPCLFATFRKSLAIDWILFTDRVVVGVVLFMGSRELALPNPSLTRLMALVMTCTKEYSLTFVTNRV